jgi:hypothetical protein
MIPTCGVRTSYCNGQAVRTYHNPATGRVFAACLMCAAALKAAGFVFHRVEPKPEQPNRPPGEILT